MKFRFYIRIGGSNRRGRQNRRVSTSQPSYRWRVDSGLFSRMEYVQIVFDNIPSSKQSRMFTLGSVIAGVSGVGRVQESHLGGVVFDYDGPHDQAALEKTVHDVIGKAETWLGIWRIREQP